jgi:flagellar hook-length control protein FliK
MAGTGNMAALHGGAVHPARPQGAGAAALAGLMAQLAPGQPPAAQRPGTAPGSAPASFGVGSGSVVTAGAAASPATAAFGAVSGAPNTVLAVGGPVGAAPSPVSGSGLPPASPASLSPAALAATVTALHQSGQASTLLRLDPPGLGTLAVHVGLGAAGQVNVLFIPAVAQTASFLHAGLDGLRHALGQAGLSLGQAQVGGQFTGQSGGHSAPKGKPGAGYPPAGTVGGSAGASIRPAPPAAEGLSAYA